MKGRVARVEARVAIRLATKGPSSHRPNRDRLDAGRRRRRLGESPRRPAQAAKESWKEGEKRLGGSQATTPRKATPREIQPSLRRAKTWARRKRPVPTAARSTGGCPPVKAA